MDAVDVADRFGIAKNRAQSFHNDSEGIALNYGVISQTISAFRGGSTLAPISDEWCAEIQADYEKRGGKRQHFR